MALCINMTGNYRHRKRRLIKAMASSRPLPLVLSLLLLLISQLSVGHGFQSPPPKLAYHGGPLLTGNIDVSILYYGRIGRVQKSVIRTFLKSLNSVSAYGGAKPTVSTWWSMVESYQSFAGRHVRRSPKIRVRVASVVTDTSYSVGKVMTVDFIKLLVEKATAGKRNTLALIFTDRQVTVQEMCTGRCAQHGAFGEQPYVLVGNPETECPGACAWPFHKSDYGPQGVVLQPPSGNVGADAMIVSLASGLADAVTNPFNTGFFQAGGGHAGLVGAGTVCQGMFGSGAFPGYTGKIRVDPKSGGAFNSHGVKGKKFLLPAVWNPATSSCWTPV
ncbi:Phosphate-induced protein [Trema orientale]|uniref:Phosphate-induced protein n=1 Tax=Trema orientale TaxID=63057 RepID=A0A2P5BLA0_TREOI|nr:Phosphate-induced protein [Trema orientale]